MFFLGQAIFKSFTEKSCNNAEFDIVVKNHSRGNKLSPLTHIAGIGIARALLARKK